MARPDLPQGAGPRFTYQAFISYSHSADGKFAPALQAGLQQFARPWLRLRAIRVFRDQTGLAVTPDLWRAIATAMDAAEYFVLLASPQAAQSYWVDQEVQHWLSQPRAHRLLIVVTDGNLQWDAAAGAPDESRTDVLPPSLRHRAREPLWLDLRWARAAEDLSLQNPMWRDAIASLSSTIRGIPKDQLIGEDVRQHARAVRFRRGALAGLAGLAVALGIAAAVAFQQRDLAREQARIAQARQLAAQAELIRSQQPDRLPLALLMATEATRVHADSIETQQALQSVLSLFPMPVAALAHQSPVTFVDVSADQQLLATAAETDPGLWRIAEQARVATLTGANRLVRFSPDGRRIAGCCREVGVWTSAGVQQWRFTPRDLAGMPGVIAFSPDGRLLAIGLQRGSRPAVAVVDLDTGQSVFRRETQFSGHADAVAFSPAGDLAIAFRDVVELFSAATWQSIRTLNPKVGAVRSIAFRADGRYLASSTSNDEVTVFDLEEDHPPVRLAVRGDGPGQLMDLEFSPDGQYLAAVGELNTGAIWSVPEWREIVAVRHREFQTIASLSFDASATEAISCGWDGDCIGWSLATGRKIHQFAHQHAYAVDDDRTRAIGRGVFVGRTSRFATAGRDGQARIWDLAPATEVSHERCAGEVLTRTFTPRSRSWNTDHVGGDLAFVPSGCGPVSPADGRQDPVVVSPDDTHAAAVVQDDVVRVWNIATGASVARLSDPEPVDWSEVERRVRSSLSERAAILALQRLKAGSTRVLAVSSSGARVATLRTADGRLCIWDTRGGRVVHAERPEAIPIVEFLSDARVLRVEAERGMVAVIDLTGGARTVWSTPLRSIGAVTVSGDGRFVAAAEQGESTGTVRVWQADTGTRLFEQRMDAEIGGLIFDPAGRTLAVLVGRHTEVPTGLPQGVGVTVWEVSSGRRLTAIPQAERVVAVAFSDDGSRLAAVDQRGALVLHDLGSGESRSVVLPQAGPVGFSRSGQWLAAGSRSIRVLETATLRTAAQFDMAEDARRLDFRDGDRVLAVETVPPGDERGTRQLRRWLPVDVRAAACRVMPREAAVRQWRQMFPDVVVPAPCSN